MDRVIPFNDRVLIDPDMPGRRGLRYLERAITRDVRVPLSDDDPEMETGWRCIPVPPTYDCMVHRRRVFGDNKTVLGTLARLRRCGGRGMTGSKS